MNIDLGMMIDLKQNNSPNTIAIENKNGTKMIIVNTYIP